MTQISTAILLSLLVGSIYWRIGLSQEAIRDRFASLAFLITLLSFTAYDIVLLFHLERAIYLREHSLGLYSTSSFFVGRTLAEMPFHTLVGTIVAGPEFFFIFFFVEK
jgi:ATP-binding cassette subfamily G (WHITE) protein 2